VSVSPLQDLISWLVHLSLESDQLQASTSRETYDLETPHPE